jgi:patatin-like phospholipase/acyl hydrolase
VHRLLISSSLPSKATIRHMGDECIANNPSLNISSFIDVHSSLYDMAMYMVQIIDDQNTHYGSCCHLTEFNMLRTNEKK